MAGPAFADVPDRYDVVFSLDSGDKFGYLLADSVESNLPFRTHKALYSYSPTFLERQNVSNQYGDNFQDFFLTGSQVDFSEGEGQKFFRVNDVDSVRKYWDGLNIDPITIPGNVTLTKALVAPASTTATAWTPTPSFFVITDHWVGVDDTNLYSLNANGTQSSASAHGLGTSGGAGVGLTTDGANVYIYSENAGSVGIRKLDPLTAFSTFSSTTISQAVFLNNILFGWQSATDSLLSFDTSGASTSQFQWKNADGTTTKGTVIAMTTYGGSIYILRRRIQTELWVYDGSGVRMLANFPDSFVGSNIVVSQGIVFVSGHSIISLNAGRRPQVYYYSNGSVGKLWESLTIASVAPFGAIAPFGNGVVFQNEADNSILQYDLALGGVHTIANTGNQAKQITTSEQSSSVLIYSGSTTSHIYNSSGNYASTGYVQTSQYDFDNTLTKIFRGLKVDADIPTNTSVDIAYQLDGTGGSYTTLQAGVTSGTEYLLPNDTTGHSISVEVTLNSATGSATPTLKRVYVRAAPTLQQFRKREFLFDLSGGLRDELGKSARKCRDGTVYPYDPKTAAENLRTIATQTIPFTVQDRFDQYTCLADLQQNQEGYDGFAIYEVRPNVFIGRINLREV